MARFGKSLLLFAFVLIVGVPVVAAPTLIQQAPDNAGGSVTFGSATTPGNTIICTYGQLGTTSTPAATVSDGINGSYITASYNSANSSNGPLGIAYKLSAASVTTVNFTPGSGATADEFTCFEYSGIGGFDSGSANFAQLTSYTSNVGTMGAVTLASSSDLVILKCYTNNASATAASGYTQIDGTGGDASFTTIAGSTTFTAQIGTASTPNVIDVVSAAFTPTGVSVGGHGFSSMSTTDLSVTGTNTTATAINLNVTGTNGGISLAPNGSGTVKVGGSTPSLISSGSLQLQSAPGYSTNLGNAGANSVTIVRSGTGKIQLAGGWVGVGTATPATQLDVNGGLRIGNDAAACSSANAGEIKYSSNLMYYCNGTAWTSF